jgi:hypothetical protein
VGPRTGLDDVEKEKFLTVVGLELQLLGRPARSVIFICICKFITPVMLATIRSTIFCPLVCCLKT